MPGFKSVNIIGCSENWKQAPRDGECWGTTALILKRDVTRLFDMHDLKWDKWQWYRHYCMWTPSYYSENYRIDKAIERIGRTPKVFKRVNELKIPLYSTTTYPEVPTSVEYPLEKIKSHFGISYFGSTIDYALALAIYEEFECIDLYGVQMSRTGGYERQLKSAHFWLGFAKGAEISLKIHGKSDLLTTRLNLMYGYNK